MEQRYVTPHLRTKRPSWKRNGQYRHGERTKAAIGEQRKFSALLKIAGLTSLEIRQASAWLARNQAGSESCLRYDSTSWGHRYSTWLSDSCLAPHLDPTTRVVRHSKICRRWQRWVKPGHSAMAARGGGPERTWQRRCVRQIRRSSAAVATSREDHRSPRSSSAILPSRVCGVPDIGSRGLRIVRTRQPIPLPQRLRLLCAAMGLFPSPHRRGSIQCPSLQA
jgi:hypothetical protein